MSTVVKRKSIVAAGSESNCGTCKKMINDAKESSIQCDQCLKWVHIPCSGLKPSEVEPALDDSNLPFKCVLCSRKANNQLLTTDQFNVIMSRLDELTSIKSSLSSLSESHATFQAKLDGMQKECASIQHENKGLKKIVDSLNVRVKTLENVRLKSQLFFKISSAALDKKEPASTVVKIGAAVGINIQKQDFRSAVVQEKMSGKESSVVKLHFKDEDVKFEFLKNRQQIRTKFKDAAFFDVLSKDNADLYKCSRALLSKGFAFVYHRSGKIYAKKVNEAVPILIKSKAMVDELITRSESSTAAFSTPDGHLTSNRSSIFGAK